MKKINSDCLDNLEYDKALLEYLRVYITEHKQKKFEEILDLRTRSLTIVLEDIFKPHNASAAMRTAECFGVQDIHIVEQENSFDFNPYVLRGSGKWLSYHHHNEDNSQNIEACFKQLKSDGYSILATSPHEYAVDYKSIELPEKVAVVFGAEETGISPYVQEHADHLITIPMMGFTESFNISVSAAIILEHYNNIIRQRGDWELNKEEKFSLQLEWFKKVVPNLDVHLRHFQKKHKS
ncbi:MAG: RNA methyltransferase [Reichenbachiella sp.]